MIRIDTNYIVRYLINDNIEMADIAGEILTTKNVFISNEILADDKKLNQCIKNLKV